MCVVGSRVYIGSGDKNLGLKLRAEHVTKEASHMYAPVLTAVPELNVERSFSIGDFRGSQCYTAQDLNDLDVKNREYYSKSHDSLKWEHNPNVDNWELNLERRPPVPLPSFNRQEISEGEGRRFR